MVEKRYLLGVGFSYIDNKEVLEYITKSLKKNNKKYYIVTPNPELLVIASRLKKYKEVLNKAELALPDGMGILLAGVFLGKRLKERLTGVDLMTSLCREVSKQPITVGFLGGRGSVADKTAKCLKTLYPTLKVLYTGEDLSENEIKTLKLDILFVAYGSPKQEFWIFENLDKLQVKIAIGVGGSFDFISGKVRRAPLFIRKIGLEWFFRLLVQPWRIKRQLSLLVFILLVFKEKLMRDRNKV